MEYARIYTALLTHPKWLTLSATAKALIVQAWMFSALQETDGIVPDAAKKVIGYQAKAALELEQACWWHRNGDGYILHDWQDHQVNGAELNERRQRLREQWRESKAKARREGRAP